MTDASREQKKQNHQDPRFPLKNIIEYNQTIIKIKQSSSNAMESSYQEVTEVNRPGDTGVNRERKAGQHVGEVMIHKRDVEVPPISTTHNIAYATSNIKHTAF